VKSLPAPLTTVRVPELFSPSQLASGDRCRLRAVLGSSWENEPSLNSHPAAETGRVFHRLLELAARGQIPRKGSAEEDVLRSLNEILTEAHRRLAKDAATRVFADLSQTVSRLVWLQKVGVVTGIAVRLLKSAPAGSPSAGSWTGGPITFDTLPDAGEWAEVKILAPQLRLAGRIDLVEKRAGLVILRDLKSGRIEDHQGQILPHIELQLRLYGIMALATEPDRTVHLFVDGGVEHEVPFDAAIAEETVSWAAEFLAGLPVGDAKATDLASPGAQCRFCPYRHVCGAYLGGAPERWRVGAVEALPLDIWGVVESFTARPGGLVDVVVRDDAGRKGKVFGVLMARIEGANVGDRLYFFGLRGRPRRMADGLWHHPLNFFEVLEDTPRDRAWSLEVFRSEPAG
jgi:RecB family exonuclease